MAYPFIVYAAWGRVPGILLIALALMLTLLRTATLRRLGFPSVLAAGLTLAAILGLLSWADPALAVRAYPVLVSLLFASAFGLSLLQPPPLVERLARLREPDLPAEGVAYTRKVTIVWTLFLLGNAAVSTLTALSGDLELWTVYNGLVSYLLAGLLFAVEYIIRRRVRGRWLNAS